MNAPKVIGCDANECAFNTDSMCHAIAITIGGTVDHKCDTYCEKSKKGGMMNIISEVGACKVTTCMHNDQMLCSAQSIQVGHVGSEVDCLSYSST